MIGYDDDAVIVNDCWTNQAEKLSNQQFAEIERIWVIVHSLSNQKRAIDNRFISKLLSMVLYLIFKGV